MLALKTRTTAREGLRVYHTDRMRVVEAVVEEGLIQLLFVGTNNRDTLAYNTSSPAKRSRETKIAETPPAPMQIWTSRSGHKVVRRELVHAPNKYKRQRNSNGPKRARAEVQGGAI